MTAACELPKPQLLAVVESCNSDTEACSCSVPLKRSNSCSALSDASFATEETYPAEDDYSVHSCDAVQEALAYADDSSVHSCDASLVLSTAINDSCSLSGAVAEQTSAEQAASHLHRRRKHKHKHRHKHRTGSAHNHASHDRSSSAQDFRGRKGGTEGRLAEQSLMALLESSRPRSFTGPVRPYQSSRFGAAPSQAPRFISLNPAVAAIPRNTAKPISKFLSAGQLQHMGNIPTAHVTAGRRAPGLLKQQACGGAAVGGSHAAAVLGLASKPRPERIIAECQKPEAIAKGFGPQWFSKRSLDVFTGISTPAPAAKMLQNVPTYAGLHLWVVRAPRSRQWVPVHLGSADNLQQVLSGYIHVDGSCGPVDETFKYKVMMDLMCRGFAVQIRFRPVKSSCSTAKEDELCKLGLFDFPLNDKFNGGCRPIELPNGWQVVEYPIVNDAVNQLYETLFGPRRMH